MRWFPPPPTPQDTASHPIPDAGERSISSPVRTDQRTSTSFQDDGEIRGFNNNEEPTDELLDSCDIATCAMRGDAWDGPEMSCYCRHESGGWGFASVNLGEFWLSSLSLSLSSVFFMLLLFDFA